MTCVQLAVTQMHCNRASVQSAKQAPLSVMKGLNKSARHAKLGAIPHKRQPRAKHAAQVDLRTCTVWVAVLIVRRDMYLRRQLTTAIHVA